MTRFPLTFLVLLIALPAGIAWSHGTEHHHDSEEMSSHMQQMLELKEQVPAEYRVMDRTPVTPDAQSLQRGAELYGKYCLACHGAGGRGDGPAAGGLEPRPANFLELKHSAIYGPGEKYWIIGNGSGKTGMPGCGKELSPAERWDLVNHIYRLQQGEK